jgi:GT2 family glycosyltransferase
MQAWVVIPTVNARELLARSLASLDRQTRKPAGIVVVDNASTDGTASMVRERFPGVELLRLESNVGFGRAINRGVAGIAPSAAVVVLVNNDCTCDPRFLERLLAPFQSPQVGMVAGVLLQGSAPDLIDSAGFELDVTLRSWDLGWNEPLEPVSRLPEPVGPCGGAAAYRLAAFREAGGFDEALFAYWEDVDLALRLRAAGWECVRAPEAVALHEHGATLGAASPAARRLEAFGRAYVLAKYRVAGRGLRTRLWIALLDWPVLIVHLVVRREPGPIRARLRGTRAGLAQPRHQVPAGLATVPGHVALRRQLALLGLRARGELPAHFRRHGPAGGTDRRGTRRSSPE